MIGSRSSTQKARRPLFVFAMTLSLSLTGSRASAEDPEHWRVTMGQPAPFSGQCMSPERSIRLGLLASQCEDRIAIETERVSKLRDIDVGLCRQKRAIESETCRATRQVFEGALESSESWTRSPVLWFSAGVVVAVLAVVVARHTVIVVAP
jgi:hypothetical protein